MNDYILVPREITEAMADAIGCTPEQYRSIIQTAALFAPDAKPFAQVT